MLNKCLTILNKYLTILKSDSQKQDIFLATNLINKLEANNSINTTLLATNFINKLEAIRHSINITL